MDQTDGYIAEVIDEATGIIDEVLTKGNLRLGLKIDGTEENHDTIGLYFEPVTSGLLPQKQA